ncbi:MAG: glycosyltransferase family 2 protein [Thiobacillus sp.]
MSVSTVIPAYNAGRFIEEAVKSIRQQGAAVSEIIIVDDGSTDNTAEVVAALGHDIQYVRQENAGPSAARNLGIKLAKSPWIAFLDADDVWTPNKVAEQMAVFQASPDVGLVASDMAEIDWAGNMLVPSLLEAHDLLRFFQRLDGSPVPQALRRLIDKNFIPTGTVIAKRQLLLELGGFKPNIRYGEDLELWARVAAHVPVVCLPSVHMLRRQHGSNATQETGPMLNDLVKVMRNVRESCGTKLRAQGVDPDATVAKALFDLAYWHFVHGDLGAARDTFSQSLSCKPDLKTALYMTASRLPAPVVNVLRQAKQYLGN